jgi:hypothetical protein
MKPFEIMTRRLLTTPRIPRPRLTESANTR